MLQGDVIMLDPQVAPERGLYSAACHGGKDASGRFQIFVDHDAVVHRQPGGGGRPCIQRRPTPTATRSGSNFLASIGGDGPDTSLCSQKLCGRCVGENSHALLLQIRYDKGTRFRSTTRLRRAGVSSTTVVCRPSWANPAASSQPKKPPRITTARRAPCKPRWMASVSPDCVNSKYPRVLLLLWRGGRDVHQWPAGVCQSRAADRWPK